MKFLITGATGFVGSWLTRYLIDKGHSVRVLRRASSDTSELTGLDVEHCLGDILDLDSLQKAAKGVDGLFHLAGYVGYSKAARPLMDQINVQGTKNVIATCLSNSINRLLHMSSVVAVGASFTKTPLNEDSPYQVSHLNLGYFETKRQAELLVQQAVQNQSLNAVIVNPSTIYGAGDAKKGSRKVQLKVARGKFPFYTSGGVSIIAVEDAVQATFRAWEVGRPGERYILSGDNITIKELFSYIAHEAGVRSPAIYLPNPAVKTIGLIGDGLEAIGKKGPLNSENAWTSILYHWFDHSKASKELGLQPKPAKEAIKNSVHWMKEQGLLNQ